MTDDVETRIRERAHHIWESEGRPEGRAEAHWQMAASEVTNPKTRRAAPTGRGAETTPKRRAKAPAQAEA